MSIPSFAVIAERAIEALLENIESIEAMDDADIDLIDGVLIIAFDDGSQIIINRQEPSKQLWMVTSFGPAHFNMIDEGADWHDDKTVQSLRAVLSRALSEKTGSRIEL